MATRRDVVRFPEVPMRAILCFALLGPAALMLAAAPPVAAQDAAASCWTAGGESCDSPDEARTERPKLRGTQVAAALIGAAAVTGSWAWVAEQRGAVGYEIWLPALALGYPLGVAAGVAIEGNVGGRKGAPLAALAGCVLGALPGLALAPMTAGASLFVAIPVGSIWLFNKTARPRPGSASPPRPPEAQRPEDGVAPVGGPGLDADPQLLDPARAWRLSASGR
jgi:hypothetical protein